MSDEVVALTATGSEPEAAVICGFLESHGIEAIYDQSGAIGRPPEPGRAPAFDGLLGGASGWAGGRQEVLVRARDYARAKTLLTAVPG